MKTIERNRCILTVVSIMIFVLMPLPIGATDNKTIENAPNTTIYKSLVDQDYGFYRVTDTTTHKPAPYVNNTLTIYVGDTVIWENDATPDEPLTIISKQKLWGNRSAYLRWNYQKFSYTFNQSGNYSVYISEYPRETHQKIIVKNIPGTISVTSMSTVTLIVNQTDNPIVTNNIPSKGSGKGPVKSSEKNLIPIEAIMAIAGLILLVIYIYRKNK